MESNSTVEAIGIVGAKLTEIHKMPDEVKLVFENSKTNKIYVLTYEGLLFETSASTLNRQVKDFQVNKTLGYRATSQLRFLNRDPQNYKQMYIQMEGSSDDNKLELLGAFTNYRISLKRHISTHRIKKKAS